MLQYKAMPQRTIRYLRITTRREDCGWPALPDSGIHCDGSITSSNIYMKYVGGHSIHDADTEA